jgi:hypothetical protein
MKYYINTNKEIFAYEEDGSQDYLIGDKVAITIEELEAINKAKEDEYKAEQEKIVPQTISPRQARLILLKYELLDDIEAMIATDRALGIWWEYSLDIQRDNEYLLRACTALGITDEQLDNMFKEANKL